MLRKIVVFFFVMLAGLCGLAGQSVASERAFYYNPDGGQYIHLDPECETISSKYWPIMVEATLEDLKAPKLKGMRLCSTCGAEKNNVEAFFRGKKDAGGPFDLTAQAEEKRDFYLDCYQIALDFMIDDLGDPLEQYQTELVERSDGWWGYPDEGEVSREGAIALAYAVLETYLGIGEDDLCLYYVDPWLDIQTKDYHEWMVRMNRILHTYRFFNSSGYYIFINAENGLISKIERY